MSKSAGSSRKYHVHVETLGFQLLEIEADTPGEAISKAQDNWANETPIDEEIEADWPTATATLAPDVA